MKITSSSLFIGLMLLTGMAAQAETGYLPSRAAGDHYKGEQLYQGSSGSLNDDEDVYERTEDYGSVRYGMGRGRLPRQVRFADLCSGNYFGVSDRGDRVRMTIRPQEDGRTIVMMTSYSGTIHAYARCVQSALGARLATEGHTGDRLTATISTDGKVMASLGKTATFNMRRIYR